VDVVQVREKDATARELHALVLRVAELTVPIGRLLFVNDRLDVAIAAGADGVQLGQGDLPLADARRIAPAGLLIGVSTHSLEQARAASEGGSDLLGFGPIFPTPTKPEEPAIGAGGLAEAVAAARCPVFAIGGLDAKRIVGIGARRAAVSGAILASEDPKETAAEIRRALEMGGGLGAAPRE
jgi:thiamine-phosphate pyrophosphorylase